MNWVYGLTTVPSRAGDLLPRTLASLAKGGFDKPHLFVDGTPDAHQYEARYQLPVTVRGQTIRGYGNWLLALMELWLRYPGRDRYAIFQDDLVMCRNVREYLEKSDFPKRGYLNLYTFPQNHRMFGNKKDFYVSNQAGLGALALVFNATGVLTLLCSEHMMRRPLDPHRGHKYIDGGVVTGMNKAGFKEFIHNPSLVQHTGDESSMGNKKHPKAPTFPGEEFDALELLR